jgi:hypothetical protein
MAPPPHTTRIASPAFDRSVGVDVLAVGVLALLAPFVVPAVGGYVMVAGLVIAALIAMRRRTIGAYIGEDAITVRGYLSSVTVPWSQADAVRVRRDPWLPWLKTAAIARPMGAAPVVVTGLRHAGDPPSPVLTLTRMVRDRRELRSRETWDR